MTHARYAAALAGFLAVTLPLSAQTGVAERLRGRVAPEVVVAAQRLAREAAAKGIPVELIVQKAIEGGAKGVPAPRVVAALEALAVRLETAARAARSAGLAAPDPATVESGAFALGTGIGEQQLERLVRSSRPPHAPDVTLRVAGALAALGVPPGQTVELVVQAIEAGRPVAGVVSLPAQVQVGIGRGLTPADAAAGAARGSGRGGPSQQSPGRPTGPREGKRPHPPHPPHPAGPPGQVPGKTLPPGRS